MSDNTLTLAGNLTADPELRFVPTGAAVANFTVANTQRKFNKQSNEWEDGDTLFMVCTLWRQAAENAAESLSRGDRVVVTGRLKQRSYETKEGEKRTVTKMDVEEVAVSLKNATAKVTRAGRGGGQSAPSANGWGAPQAAPAAAPVQAGGNPFDASPF